MYRILIVDDEEFLRKAIISKLNWEEIGFDFIDEAEDGEQALEIALSLKPDVVLTDVKMPFMDGLELSKKLIETLPNTKIIVLSGYDEFEYAQAAIKIGALDYILKPINSIKLTELLSNIKKSLDAEKTEEMNLLKLRSQLHQSVPLLKERFFNSLITNSLSVNEISDNLNFLEIKFTNEYYIVCVAEIDDLNILKNNKDTENIALINFSVINIISELLQTIGFVFNDTANRQVLIISLKNPTITNDEYNVYDLLQSVKLIIEKFLKITLTIGMGRIVSDLHNIHHSYREAVEALTLKVYKGKNRIYNIEDLNYKELDMNLYMEKINAITTSIKLERVEVVQEQINSFFDELLILKSGSINNLRILMIELITSIQKVLIGMKIEYEKENTLDFQVYEKLNRQDTLEDFKSIVSAFVLKSCKIISASRNSRNHAIIEKAKQYIDNHYFEEDLSQDIVAKIVLVSPGYLSILFKKETNENFIAYLTKVRMENAKVLLKTTALKTSEVAFKVGYRDPHYFGLCFKKYTCLTPLEYKNNNT